MRRITATLLLLGFILIQSCGTESTPVYTLTSNAEPAEAGSVAQGATEAEEGESIQVTATANQHWVFTGWQGDLSGSQNPASVLMDRDKSVTARFVKRDYPLTVNIEGSGEVTEEVLPARTTEYQHGTTVQLTAVADDGWVFFEWGGNLTDDQNPQTILVDEGKQVTSVFKSIEELLVTEVVGGGTIEILQQTADENPSRRIVTVSATADQNWEFQGWTGDVVSDSSDIEIELNASFSITATFSRSEFTLTTSVDGSGSVNRELVSGSQTDNGYLFESVVRLSASGETGWRFIGWEGDLTGSESPKELFMDSNKDVTAVFDNPEFTIALQTDGSGSASVTPQKEVYRFGEEVTFTAAPAAGHEFMGWSGSIGGRSRSQNTIVEDDLNVTARFSAIEDALVYRFSGGTFINDRVFGASLSLSNQLPEAIVLRKFALLNSNGVELTSASDNETIGAGRQISYNISFGIAPTQQQFSQYIAAWHVTYKGTNYLKQTRVGFIGTSAKEIGEEEVPFARTLHIEE